MSLKSFAARIFAKFIDRKTRKWSENPIETQNKVFKYLKLIRLRRIQLQLRKALSSLFHKTPLKILMEI